METNKRLTPGRHQLSRAEVKTNQRERIFEALETVMSVQGYHGTSVADLIGSAEVSRQTFYELFASKEDCFLAGYARRQFAVISLILQTPPNDSPMERFDSLLKTYLTVMAANPAMSRLYLIGAWAAGPQAIAKRLELQQHFVDGVATMLDARTEEDRFTCQTLVAAISTLVTTALLDEDPQAVLDLREPLMRLTRRLMAPG